MRKPPLAQEKPLEIPSKLQKSIAMSRFVGVALPIPMRDIFSYKLEDGCSTPKPGMRVRVKFGPRELIGVIESLSDSCDLDPVKIKSIEAVLDEEPLIPPELMSLCRWAAKYYLYPLGEVISAALPQRLREGKALTLQAIYRHTAEGLGLPETALKRSKTQQALHVALLSNGSLSDDELTRGRFSRAALRGLLKKGLVEKADAATTPKPAAAASELRLKQLLNEPPLSFNAEQRTAFDTLRYHHYACYLLDGVTGSGKTEIYLQAAARVLQGDKQVLVLIPEIGLSPQTVERFKRRFNVEIAELHSNISETKRAQGWAAAASGSARIVIGTRLASLTPFQDLGLIIVDEEHDRSYRQQDGFRYSARDLSIYRAHTLGIPIVLGSATPSLESLANTARGKYSHLLLHTRAGGATQPTFEKVDLRNKPLTAGLSEEVLNEMSRTLARNEQLIVFINRRGYAPALLCHSCGWSADCSHCDTRMTVHSFPKRLHCHHCERWRPPPSQCPTCGSSDLKTSGYGTEQIEQSLKLRFPDTLLMRIDADSTRKKDSLQHMLANAKDGGACIFVGTQMLAKGHHLPALSLVVIADADQGLLGPDFRSLEHMGQLLIQIAGRAGRETTAGKVLVQTHRPDHPALVELLEKGYSSFAQGLLSARQRATLPPYASLYEFRAEGKKAAISIELLTAIKNILIQHSQQSLQVVGPFPDSIERVNGRYRYCLSATSSQRSASQAIISQALKKIETLALAKRVRWSLTVD